MQWVRARARVRLGSGSGLVLVALFQKHFVGIAVVGIAACTQNIRDAVRVASLHQSPTEINRNQRRSRGGALLSLTDCNSWPANYRRQRDRIGTCYLPLLPRCKLSAWDVCRETTLLSPGIGNWRRRYDHSFNKFASFHSLELDFLHPNPRMPSRITYGTMELMY